MSDRVTILGVELDSMSMRELLERFDDGVLVTANVDHLIQLQQDADFREAYSNAEYRTVDSQILCWSLRFLGTPVPEKISGSDFFPAFYWHHKNNTDVKAFLLGAAPGIAEEAARRINQKVGREFIVGTHSPSMGFEKDPVECDEVRQIIGSSDANILIVGLGAPKQEIWISKNRALLPNIRIFMALGATIDFEAENVSRAPVWMSKCGLEWFYRLTQDPRRLWYRYIVRGSHFPLLLLKQRLGKYQAPTSLN